MYLTICFNFTSTLFLLTALKIKTDDFAKNMFLKSNVYAKFKYISKAATFLKKYVTHQSDNSNNNKNKQRKQKEDKIINFLELY